MTATALGLLILIGLIFIGLVNKKSNEERMNKIEQKARDIKQKLDDRHIH